MIPSRLTYRFHESRVPITFGFSWFSESKLGEDSVSFSLPLYTNSIIIHFQLVDYYFYSIFLLLHSTICATCELWMIESYLCNSVTSVLDIQDQNILVVHKNKLELNMYNRYFDLNVNKVCTRCTWNCNMVNMFGRGWKFW